MKHRRDLVFVGPIAPPAWGPAIKNKIITESLPCHGVEVIPINTLGWTRRALPLTSEILRATRRTPRVMISVSRNGRATLLPLLHLASLAGRRRIILAPAGGGFGNDLESMRPAIRRVYLACCRRCTLVLAQTEGLARQLERLGLANVHVFPNCKPDIQPSAHRTEASAGMARIAYVGRVRPEKGIEVLLQALDAVQSRGITFTLDFYGIVKDDYEKRFREQLQSRPWAHYGGVLASDELLSRLAGFDLMVFPTLCEEEGFPGVLADAALAGVPVIATDLSFNAEIVRDGVNGLLVTPGDVHQLADRIGLLLHDHTLRGRLAAANREAGRQYTTDVVLTNLVERLDQLGFWEA